MPREYKIDSSTVPHPIAIAHVMQSFSFVLVFACCAVTVAMNCYDQILKDQNTKPTNSISCPSGTKECYQHVAQVTYFSGAVDTKVTYGCDTTGICNSKGRKRRDIMSGGMTSTICCNKNNCNSNSGSSMGYMAAIVSTAIFAVFSTL